MGTRLSWVSTEQGQEGKPVKVVCGSTSWGMGRECHKWVCLEGWYNGLGGHEYQAQLGRVWHTANDSSKGLNVSQTRQGQGTSSLHRQPHLAHLPHYEGSVLCPRSQTSQCKLVPLSLSPVLLAAEEEKEPGHPLRIWRENLLYHDCGCKTHQRMCSVACWDSS